MKWYMNVLRKYADFTGRARRKEYWMFVLFNFVFLIIAIALDNLLQTTFMDLPYGLFYFQYVIAMIVPGLAVTVRRLHDIGKSGWMALICLIPFIGGIWLLVLMLSDSKAGENEYGINPKDYTIVPKVKTSMVNAGTALIISSVLWLVVIIFEEFNYYIPSGYYAYGDIMPIIINKLFCLTPIALLVVGISLVQRKTSLNTAAFCLLAACAAYLLVGILGAVPFIQNSFEIYTICSWVIMSFLVPIGLIMVGLSLLNPILTSNKTAAICLIVISSLWILNNIFWSNLQIKSDSIGNSYLFLIQLLVVISPISLLVLVNALLKQNKQPIS